MKIEVQKADTVLEASAIQVFIGEAEAKGLEMPCPSVPNSEAYRFLVVFRMGNKHHKNSIPMKAKRVFYFELLYLGCRMVVCLRSSMTAIASPNVAPKANIVIEPPLSIQLIFSKSCLLTSYAIFPTIVHTNVSSIPILPWRTE